MTREPLVEPAVLSLTPLGFQWETLDPFLFCLPTDPVWRLAVAQQRTRARRDRAALRPARGRTRGTSRRLSHCSRSATSYWVNTLAQRDLRNQSAEILRRAEAGETFLITVDGRQVAQLGPSRRREWVPRDTLRQALAGLRADKTLLSQLKKNRLTGATMDVTDPWESP